MDLVRFGLIVRALRRRKGWRQVDLAAAAKVSQTQVSLIERGHADRLLLADVFAVIAAVEARLNLEIRWRGGELDRLVDQDHASIAAALEPVLAEAGWDVHFEVTYAVYGASGSVDVLAWHAPTGTLLVIEIKTEVTSAEATVRKLDEKARLGARIAWERFGWRAQAVARMLVIQDTSTARARVRRADAVFRSAFPTRSTEARRWLRAPAGSIAALLYLRPSRPTTGMSRGGGRHRVRCHSKRPATTTASVENGGRERPTTARAARGVGNPT